MLCQKHQETFHLIKSNHIKVRFGTEFEASKTSKEEQKISFPFSWQGWCFRSQPTPPPVILKHLKFCLLLNVLVFFFKSPGRARFFTAAWPLVNQLTRWLAFPRGMVRWQVAEHLCCQAVRPPFEEGVYFVSEVFSRGWKQRCWSRFFFLMNFCFVFFFSRLNVNRLNQA